MSPRGCATRMLRRHGSPRIRQEDSFQIRGDPCLRSIRGNPWAILKGERMLRFLTLVLAFAATAGLPARSADPPWDPVATFSILGYDAATGEVGGALQSRVFWVRHGVRSAR